MMRAVVLLSGHMQILLLCLYLSLFVNGVLGGIVINKGVHQLMGEQCPGTVNLVCEGVDLTLLRWRYIVNNVPTSEQEIKTFISTDMVNKTIPPLGVPTAFISTQLVSVSVSTSDSRFANFTSILTVDMSLLNEQNITEIRCGDSVSFAVERVDITIIEEPLPEAPVITHVSVVYQNSILERIEISWQKASVQCPSFESSLLYEVTLSDTGDVTSKQLSQHDCNDDCFTMFDHPKSNLSTIFQVNVSAINSIGTNSASFSIERQSSLYLNLSVSFMDCITSVQCFPLVGSNCSVQYTAASDSGSGGQSVPESLLPQDTTYNFTAISTVLANNYPLRVTEKKSFTTGSFSPRLSTNNIAQISVGVVLTAFSLVVVFGTIGFMLRLCGTSVSASQTWKTSLSVCSIVITLLWLVCFTLWIAVACITGLQNDTCDLDWQQTRDALTAAALAVSCLTFVAGSIVMVVTCCYYHKAYKTFILKEDEHRSKAEESAPKGWIGWITSKLPSWPWSRSNNMEQSHEYNHLNHGSNETKPQKTAAQNNSHYEQVNPPKTRSAKASAKQQDIELKKTNEKEKQSRPDETDGGNEATSGCTVQ